MLYERNNIEIIKYSSEKKQAWNNFVLSAKNSTFLFIRDFMEYHADRFIDHSLMVSHNNKLVAIFPANERGTTIQSHGGLTYGGLVFNLLATSKLVVDIWDNICNYFQEAGFEEIYYKAIPKIYHSYPSDEDLYALFRTGAELVRRDISYTIENNNRPKLSKGRKWLLARAKKLQLIIREQNDFLAFMELETENLERKYNTKPIHSGHEMNLLNSRFPDQVKLFEAVDASGELLAGLVLFITDTVAHAQYIASSDKGKEIGAFDLIIEYVWQRYQHLKYFDFGISTEENGRLLNEGLAAYKESYGARGTACDFYLQKL